MKKDKKYHKKLIRDRIPEIIESMGGGYETRKLDDEEFKKRLREKLVEEANELVGANRDELEEELADVLQVVRSLSEAEGVDFKSIEKKRKEKKEKRGAFEKKLFLIWSTRRKDESSNS